MAHVFHHLCRGMGKVSLKPLSYSSVIITSRPLKAVTVLVSLTNEVTKGEVPKPQLLIGSTLCKYSLFAHCGREVQQKNASGPNRVLCLS